MASLKEIKGRISTVKKTRKITSAMRMVASAKLHKAQAAIENMIPYQQKLNVILTNFLSAVDASLQSPYIVERPVNKVAVVVYSSNSSLCGAFNANVIKLFTQTMANYQHLSPDSIIIYPIGRKIEEAVRKMGYNPEGSYQNLANKPSYEEAFRLADEIMNLFVQEKVDKVEMIFHHFKSSGTQELLYKQYLPLNPAEIKAEILAEESSDKRRQTADKYRMDYIVEPSEEEFVATLLPQFLRQQIFTALLDSAASEHAARMIAMQIATDNANGLIDELSKQYNKTRQQSITNELLDIIGGSMK